MHSTFSKASMGIPNGYDFLFPFKLFQNICYTSVKLRNFRVRLYYYFRNLRKYVNFPEFNRENSPIFVFRPSRYPPP